MNTSRKFKIIVFGSGLVMLMIALRLITSFNDHGRVDPASIVSELREGVQQPSPATNRLTTRRKSQMPRPSKAVPPPEVVNITYDLRQHHEQELIDKMNLTLLDLGIQKDERTCRQLVLARVKGDWSHTPPGPDWADNAMWQKHSADMLKHRIATILNGTNTPPDALTIKRVLECEIGPTIPPMEDYEIHD